VFFLLIGVSVILVRYSEIGLKSKPVRKRFEMQLKDNMMSMFLRDKVEALVTSDSSRIYVVSSDTEAAAHSIRRVFGVASLSIAETCGSSMEEICAAAAKYSLSRIKKGQSFAVKARREGQHPYNSMELGKEAGSAIYVANGGLKVDLTDPDIIFYIEVRNNKAYIFDSYIRAHAGLPLGSQGKVIAEVNDERGLLSAWLMMKRGCKALVVGDHGTDVLNAFDPSLKTIGEDEREHRRDILGVVKGTSIGGLNDIDVTEYNVPVYFPTIGMDDKEVADMLSVIRSEI
jgi:thiamine biosynthesis protein ThiI